MIIPPLPRTQQRPAVAQRQDAHVPGQLWLAQAQQQRAINAVVHELAGARAHEERPGVQGKEVSFRASRVGARSVMGGTGEPLTSTLSRAASHLDAVLAHADELYPRRHLPNCE